MTLLDPRNSYGRALRPIVREIDQEDRQAAFGLAVRTRAFYSAANAHTRGASVPALQGSRQQSLIHGGGVQQMQDASKFA